MFLLFVPMRITVLDQVLASLGETKFVFKAQVGTMIVNIVLGYALVRNAGWLGPAIAAVFTGYLFAALLILEIRHRLGVSLERLIPWQILSHMALVAILAAACSAVVALLGTALLWKVGVGFVVFATVYLIGNLKIKSITAGDLQILWSWVLTAPGSPMRKQVLGSARK
jgi:O-antigen/teichoic acid export membrane protein